MSLLEALWLGLVQGLTEFLPVSSSGNLVIARTLLGVGFEGDLVFEIVVHAATAVAIATYYRRRLRDLWRGVRRREAEALGYLALLGLATLPAVAVGLFARDLVERLFMNPVVTGLALLVTGFIVWTTRRSLAAVGGSLLNWRIALWIGCAQAVAIVPGISRSGTTVAVALALGLAPAVAAEFAFLLGIVAIGGAVVLMLPDLTALTPDRAWVLAGAALAALVSGLAAIWLFVRMLESRTFYYFAWYAWAAGGGFLLWLAVNP